MNSTNFKFIIYLAVTFVLFSCKKAEIIPISDIENGPATGSNALYSGTMIQSTIGGKVIDESNNSIANALVTIGNQTTNTNEDGVFLIQNVSVDSKRAYVKVYKSGYFLGSRAVKPSSSASSFVKIKLLTKSTTGSFNSSVGGTISVNGGASLIFEEGDVSLENGSPYNGSVTVYAKYINPTRPDLGEVMPGNLAAINSNGEAVILETFGMLSVELSGSNGEALNIAPGRTVELKFPVVNEQSAHAPGNIPLWYFDEVTGNWQEEGSAIRDGDLYSGHVSHFSIWNCDYPYTMKTVKMRIESGGQPVANALIQVTDQSNTYTHGYSYTNSNGELEEMVPGDLAVKFIIKDECGNESYSQNVNPGLTDIDFGTIQINPPNSSIFTATIRKCSGTPVPNAVVAVNMGGSTVILTADNNGSINAVVLTCNVSSIEVTAYDYGTALQSTPANYSVGAFINAGIISLCSQADEYFIFTANSMTYSIIDTGNDEIFFYTYIIDSLSSEYGLDLSANSLNGDGLYIQLKNPVIGNNVAMNCSIWGEVSPGQWWSGYAEQAPEVTITGGNINGPYLEGSINGTIYDDATNASIPITGSFRAKLY